MIQKIPDSYTNPKSNDFEVFVKNFQADCLPNHVQNYQKEKINSEPDLSQLHAFQSVAAIIQHVHSKMILELVVVDLDIKKKVDLLIMNYEKIKIFKQNLLN